MSDWNKRNDRKEATWKLIERLDSDPNLRQQCRTDPARARKTLQECGDFNNMPADVEIRIMESNEADRDKLVAIILPPAGELPAREGFESDEFWTCSWTKWIQ